MTVKLVNKLLKEKFPAKIDKQAYSHWGKVKLSNFVDPKAKMIEKYHV